MHPGSGEDKLGEFDLSVLEGLGASTALLNGAAFQISRDDILHQEQGRGSFFLRQGQVRVVMIEGNLVLAFQIAESCEIVDELTEQPVSLDIVTEHIGVIRGALLLSIRGVSSAGEVYSERPLVAFDYSGKIKELSIEMSYRLIGKNIGSDPLRVTYVIVASGDDIG